MASYRLDAKKRNGFFRDFIYPNEGKGVLDGRVGAVGQLIR